MKRLTFLQLAECVLRQEKAPLTATQIWKIAQETGLADQVESKGKTPASTIYSLLYKQTLDPRSRFARSGATPRSYYLKEVLSEEEANKLIEEQEQVGREPEENEYEERDLHPLLTYFASARMGVYTKTIDDRKSRRAAKGFAEWAHPDLVGLQFPEGWKPEVIEMGKELSSRLITLHSFEMKKGLSFSNIRESFFQTVSNSSWANEGYLVAATIDENSDFREELERLSASFGIGIIQLDTHDPESSQIVLPAKRKDDLDWKTINRLCEMNSDFKAFIEGTTKTCRANKVIKDYFDPVLSADHPKLKLRGE